MTDSAGLNSLLFDRLFRGGSAAERRAIDQVNDFTRRMLQLDALERALQRSQQRWTPPRVWKQLRRAKRRLQQGRRGGRYPRLQLDWRLKPPLDEAAWEQIEQELPRGGSQ